MARTPKHPTLYRLGEDGSPRLLFGRCLACEALTFPANAYGCARCGSASLEIVERPAAGTLVACVTLHADLIAGLPAPQVVGDVEIAPGIVEEVLIQGEQDTLVPGMTLAGVVHPLEDGAFDLRFRVAP
jgi:uncharacterized OB-fold protein